MRNQDIKVKIVNFLITRSAQLEIFLNVLCFIASSRLCGLNIVFVLAVSTRTSGNLK